MAGRKKRIINKGDMFGKLTILSEVPSIKRNGRNIRRFLVKCICGREKEVWLSNLTGGATTSCGHCIYEKHSMCETSIYKLWSGMIQRCTNKNHSKYYLYGGNNVSICDRWLKFENFYEDMGDRPDGKSLNRINGAKIYSKETCEWASYSTQSFDQRLRKDNSSGVTGVYWNKRQQKWTAAIYFKNKRISLGSFTIKSEAVHARKQAELKYYGFLKEGIK